MTLHKLPPVALPPRRQRHERGVRRSAAGACGVSPDRRATPTRTRPPPAGVSNIIDQVMADDRRWFQTKPGVSCRKRSAVAGEFWPLEMARVMYVLVLQVEPGFRLRDPVVQLNLPESARVQ